MKTLAISLLLAAAAAIIPPSIIGDAARMLVLATSLMATGVFPCMTLVVNAMKGEHRTPALVESLYDKLRQLLKLLITAFCLAISVVVLLVTTVTLQAADAIEPVLRGAAAASAFAIAIFSGRVVAIGRAFFALLDINRKHALLIARGAVRRDRDAALDLMRASRFSPDDQNPKRLQKAG